VPINSYGGEKVSTPLDRALEEDHKLVAAYLESKGGKRYADLKAEDLTDPLESRDEVLRLENNKIEDSCCSCLII